MWSWKTKMYLGRFYLEKNQKNAIGVPFQISFPKETYIFSQDTSCLWYSIQCQTRGIPEVICAQRHTATCMSRHNLRWLLHLFPQTIPKMRARSVWVPGYHSFPKWAIRVRIVYESWSRLVVSSIKFFGQKTSSPSYRLLASLRFCEKRWKPLSFLSVTMFRLGILFESTPPFAQFSKVKHSNQSPSTVRPAMQCTVGQKKKIRDTPKNNSRPNERIICGMNEKIIRIIITKIIHVAKNNY